MSLMWNIDLERNMEMQMQCHDGLDLHTNMKTAYFGIQMFPNIFILNVYPKSNMLMEGAHVTFTINIMEKTRININKNKTNDNNE